jgi:acyl-CoA reductase-like NAD-dependent aldehyde dehydrogenase
MSNRKYLFSHSLPGEFLDKVLRHSSAHSGIISFTRETNMPASTVSPELADRLEILRRLGERLEAHRRELIEATAMDIGTPVSVAEKEVSLGVEHLLTMAEEVPHVQGKAPYGTVAAVFPYDAIPVMLARVGGAALLGGNRFLFSCSSQTPRSAAVVREVVAPFPEIEVATGMSNKDFGRQAVLDPEVRVFFISGGGEVGAIYEAEAAHFDKVFFAGPSGLPPTIIFRDAPLARAANFVVRRAFLNGGQYCTTTKRVYIHQDLYEDVKALILQVMPEIRVGDPGDPHTWIGPIKVERTRLLLDRALAALENPHFLWDYRRDGEWQGPFLMEVADPPDLELFGPFLALVKVESDLEAVSRVQQSRYPFLVTWFGTPPPGARETLAATFGMTYDNPDFIFTPLRLPFGGKGASGWIIEQQGGTFTKRDGAFIYSAELVRG